jgi:hypothetical protein
MRRSDIVKMINDLSEGVYHVKVSKDYTSDIKITFLDGPLMYEEFSVDIEPNQYELEDN